MFFPNCSRFYEDQIYTGKAKSNSRLRRQVESTSTFEATNFIETNVQSVPTAEISGMFEVKGAHLNFILNSVGARFNSLTLARNPCF
jgi:hypothetical protein